MRVRLMAIKSGEFFLNNGVPHKKIGDREKSGKSINLISGEVTGFPVMYYVDKVSEKEAMLIVDKPKRRSRVQEIQPPLEPSPSGSAVNSDESSN